MIGSTLAHYRITAALGAGGMGEVWRATDTRLGRQVALKVLPAEFASDPERMARFEREAKVLASLNHPNIAHLYGLETAGVAPGKGRESSEFGIRNSEFPAVASPRTDTDAHADSGSSPVTFLVMELVDGEDLSEHIKGGPIPVEEAIPIALQIAEALEAAHEAGIVHRDLKPANIKITDDGTVKVLDFGLAKAWERDAGDSSLSLSPTVTRHATVEGVILGTAAYMSPEQARGKKVDKRADIWAFGVVLWEMLTGRKLFEGETVSDVLAAILTSEPDVEVLPGQTSFHLRELLERCLQRDPKRRMRDMGDVRLELENPRTLPSPGGSEPSVEGRGNWRSIVGWAVAAGVAIAAAILGMSWWGAGDRGSSSVTAAVSIVLPPELAFTQQNSRPVLSISPNGDTLVVAADDGGVQRLYLRSLRFPELEPLEGTEGGTAPFFSPDGRWIGFSTTSDRMVKKISLDGGQVIALTRGEWGGGSWGPDDSIVYTPDYTDGLWRIPAAGGGPTQLTTPDPSVGELNHCWPDHIPGTDALVFTSFRLPLNQSRIELLLPETGERRVLVENAVFARHVSAGYLVFVREGVMLAAPFDRASLEVTGAPVPLFEDAFVAPFEGNSQYAVSENGTLVWVPASIMQPPREVLLVDRSGRQSVVLDAERRYSMPALSPDGRTLALTVDDGNPDIWLYEMDRGVLNRLTFSPRSEFGAVWHPQGRSLVFIVDDPPFNIYQMPIDGSASPSARVLSPVDSYAGGLSSDGRRLTLYQNRPESAGDIEILEMVDGAEPQDVRATPFNETFATISPDGDYVAYQSNETGRLEVYVQGVPAVGGRLQLSRAGGERPLWNRNGELYFWRGDELAAVTVRTSPELQVSEPRVLFAVDHHVSSVNREYDATADGMSFFVTRTPDVAKPREIRVVLNWFAGLERLAGSRGGS